MPEALHRLLEHGLHAFCFPHIALQAQKRRTEVFHLALQLLHAVCADIHANDFCALPGEKLRRFTANAGVDPGENSDLIG